MRVLVDETLCEMSADSVSQAIASASAVAEQRGRMIVEVIVDGRQWTSDDLDAAATSSISADELRLTTADCNELACETFRDASRALTDANQLQQTAAELLQADDVAGAMEKLQEAIAIWLSVQQALIMGLQVSDVDLTDESFSFDFDRTSSTSPRPQAAEAFKQMVEQLNSHLRGMQEALSGKDTVALADMLLYDMPPIVQRWQLFLEELQARVPHSQPDGGESLGFGQSEDA